MPRPPADAPDRIRRHSVRDAAGRLARHEQRADSAALRAVVASLGSAWFAYQLYPKAVEQAAFVSAVEKLARAPAVGAVEVGADAFVVADLGGGDRGNAADRLARRLYEHGVVALRFEAAPRPEDLIALFDVVRRSPEEVAGGGGVDEALVRLGVLSVRAQSMAMLNDDDQEESGEEGAARPRDEIEELAGDAAALAHHLMRRSDGDPELLADLVIDAYGRAMEATRHDLWDHQEMVHTFVDTFFHLPAEHRALLVGRLLERAEDPDYRTFLDQFASQELSELSAHLDPDVHPLLAKYAQIADEHRGARIDELNVLLADEDRPTAATIVARRIEEVVAPEADGSAIPRRGVMEGLTFETVGDDPTRLGIIALRRLLSIAAERQEERRLLRIWARKVAGALEGERPRAALEWLDAVDRELSPERSSDAEEALRATLRAPALAPLVAAGVLDDEARDLAEAIVDRVAPVATGLLVELLADESERARRRVLIALLERCAPAHPEPIAAHLDDPRWYLVRNLVVVLRSCPTPEVAEALRPMASHPDERVRAEALRALNVMVEDDAELFVAATTDEARTVRHVALTILRARDDAGVVALLAGVLDGPAPVEAKKGVLEHLGREGSAEARLVLQRHAAVRFAMSPESRALRTAARRALEMSG